MEDMVVKIIRNGTGEKVNGVANGYAYDCINITVQADKEQSVQCFRRVGAAWMTTGVDGTRENGEKNSEWHIHGTTIIPATIKNASRQNSVRGLQLAIP